MKNSLLVLALIAALICAALPGLAEEAPAQSNILIAYFTWADNTVVADAEASISSALEHYGNMGDNQSGVDATSSASVLVPGNTAVMAGYIHEVVGGDMFSIQVEEPYPSDYDACLDRAADELDADARPALKTFVDNMERYDIVFLGMPNWWYSCPMAVLTFVEGYDFSGKTVIPFVAHGTGGISGSVRDMRKSLPDDCAVLEPIGVYRPDIIGCRADIKAWIEGLGLVDEPAASLYIRVGNTTLAARLADNSSAEDLVKLLQAGDITIDMHDYGNIEKVGSLPEALPRNDEQITTQAGDLILYQGSQFVLYYDTNSWDFTRLGWVEGIAQDELKALLGTGDVTVTLTLKP